MNDPTESIRRSMIEDGVPERHLAKASQRWNTEELARDFTVHSFSAPFVIVTRKADGVRGTMEFVHMPRFYFGFVADPS